MTTQTHAHIDITPQSSTLGFSHGFTWLAEGWQLMRKAPFKLFGFALLPMILAGLVQLFPHASAMVASKWLATIVAASMWPLLNKLDSESQFSVKAIFSVKGWSKMAVLAAVMLITFVMQCVIAMQVIGPDALNLLLFGEMIPVTQTQLGLVFTSGIPFILLFYFAPALVLLNNSSIYSAIKQSVSSVLLAWKPMLVLLLVNGLVTFLAPFTAVLSVVLLGPWLMCSGYRAYRDVISNSAK